MLGSHPTEHSWKVSESQGVCFAKQIGDKSDCKSRVFKCKCKCFIIGCVSDWKKMLEVNVVGLNQCTQLAIKSMLKVIKVQLCWSKDWLFSYFMKIITRKLYSECFSTRLMTAKS